MAARPAWSSLCKLPLGNRLICPFYLPTQRLFAYRKGSTKSILHTRRVHQVWDHVPCSLTIILYNVFLPLQSQSQSPCSPIILSCRPLLVTMPLQETKPEALCYRLPIGTEAPELAEELHVSSSYTPDPGHDMYAFGLLLHGLLHGYRPSEHKEAVTAATQSGSAAPTLQYARSLLHLPPGQGYTSQVATPHPACPSCQGCPVPALKTHTCTHPPTHTHTHTHTHTLM